MPEVSSKVDVEVIRVESDPVTGHMTLHVQSVERISANEIRRGPIKSYGINPDALANQFNGDIQLWLAWVKQRHQQFAGVNETMLSTITALKGKKL